MGPDAALVGCRFLHDAALVLLWGGLGYLAALVPAELAAGVARRLALFWRILVVVALVTTILALPLEAGAIGEGWGDAVDPATLHAVLWETSYGTAWLIQVVAALVLAGTLLVSPTRHMPLTAVAAGLLLAGLALTGHTALHTGALGLAHGLNDAVHVLTAGAWLGSLVPLVPVLTALREAERRAQAVTALRRFSTAGHVAVALAIVSGVLNAALVLGRLPEGDTTYELLLLAKLALVAGMTAIALFNRYRLVPRLRQAPDATRRLLIVSTLAEIGLGLAAVALVATFGTLDPA